MKFDFKYLLRCDKMETITTKKELPAAIDKVREQNKPIKISTYNKRDLVICPAEWFNFIFDDDFGCIINSALRYAIGRHTYMPTTVADFVRTYVDVLDRKTIEVMIMDLDKSLEIEQLHQRHVWANLRAFLADWLHKEASNE